MFFRRRPEQKPSRFVRRLITGLIIGGAIASVLGRRSREHTQEKGEEDKKEE